MATEDTSAENSEDDNGKETDGDSPSFPNSVRCWYLLPDKGLPHHRIEAMEEPGGETGHDYWNMWWWDNSE